jgi:hypothetical protein
MCRLSSFSRSFTSCLEIGDTTNIRWVTIEYPRILLDIACYCTATHRNSVGSWIWKWEVQQRLKPHNLCIDHVTIQSEMKYLIQAKAAGTGQLELQSRSNPDKYPQFYVQSRYQPAMTRGVCVFGPIWNWTEPPVKTLTAGGFLELVANTKIHRGL